MQLLFVILALNVCYIHAAYAQQNYGAATTPYSSSQFSNPYGGVNSTYLPNMGNAFGGNSFTNAPYQNYGMPMGGNRMGGNYANNSSSMSAGAIVGLQDLMFGEGSLTSRLLRMSLLMAVTRMISNGGGNPYVMMALSASMNRGQNPLQQTFERNFLPQNARPQSMNQGAQYKLNPCLQNQGMGPTQAVSDLNQDLIKILY